MSLRQQTLAGFSWSFIQQMGVQGINFVVALILARILNPSDFGLIGMLTIFISVGNALIDSGLSSSIIRTKDADQRDYSTVFVINLVGGIVIYCLIFLSSPMIATFFEQPILEDVVKVYCLTFIIRAFSAVQAARLTKLMDFKTILVVTLPSIFLAGVAGIAMAYNGFGVWSLVWMNIIQAVLYSVQLWIRSKWTPSLMFDKARYKQHLSFGYKMTLSGLLDALYNNIYNILIGKFFSATQLGFYTKATSLKQLPVANISTALNKVTFPMFAGIQDDDQRLRNAYKKLMQQILFWIAPTLCIAGVLAEPLFRFLLTEKWLPAVPYFQILCITGITFPLHSYNLNVLKVKGRSDLFLKLEVIKRFVITGVILIAINYGIYALLWGEVFSNIIGLLINSRYSGKLISYSLGQQLLDMLPSLFVAALAGGCVYLVDFQLRSMYDVVRLVVGGTVGFCFYLGVSYTVSLQPLTEFRSVIFKKGQ
ncbi:MAG: lipopolysaccharide biosynthesis protein [Cyclobacteriaceae bacterium]